jgi:hypothetical protein
MDELSVTKAFKACVWGNSTETAADWVNILNNGATKERQRIFNTLFREDGTGEHLHSLFSLESIRLFIAELNRPFSRADLEKKRKVWRSVYLGEKNHIPELAWIPE